MKEKKDIMKIDYPRELVNEPTLRHLLCYPVIGEVFGIGDTIHVDHYFKVLLIQDNKVKEVLHGPDSRYVEISKKNFRWLKKKLFSDAVSLKIIYVRNNIDNFTVKSGVRTPEVKGKKCLLSFKVTMNLYGHELSNLWEFVKQAQDIKMADMVTEDFEELVIAGVEEFLINKYPDFLINSIGSVYYNAKLKEVKSAIEKRVNELLMLFGYAIQWKVGSTFTIEFTHLGAH